MMHTKIINAKICLKNVTHPHELIGYKTFVYFIYTSPTTPFPEKNHPIPKFIFSSLHYHQRSNWLQKYEAVFQTIRMKLLLLKYRKIN